MSYTGPGFNGERPDPLNDTHPLGNGYRAFNSRLMRFHCPDSWSPFGAGGINAYAYCAGDPVNLTDPSGHMSWQSITGIVSGVIGLALIPFTLGQSLSLIACAIAGAEAISGVTAIASGVLQKSHPRVSSVLGWTSFAVGMLSLGAGLGSVGYRLFQQVSRAKSTMVMALEDEFNYVTSLGRTSRSGARQNDMMSVIFEDRVELSANQTYRRLNIWAHGRNPDRIFINRRSLTAEMLLLELEVEGIEMADYDAVRFISCNSVNMARSFAESSWVTTTGFRGNVIVQGHTVAALRQMSADVGNFDPDVARLRFELAVEQYPARATASGVRIFENGEFFRITRGNAVSFRSRPDNRNIIQNRQGYPLPEWYVQ